MTQALYDAVKSGRVKLTDLNDEGKKALKSFMTEKTQPIVSFKKAEQKFGSPTMNPEKLPMVKEANKFAAETPKKTFAEKVQKPNVLDKIFKDNPISRVLNYPFAKAAQDSVPNANYLGTDVNAREDFAKRNPIPSTGNKTVDKIGNVAGGIGSIFTPIGTGGAFINDIGKGASALLNTKLGTKVVNGAADLVNPALNNVGINVSNKLAANAGQSFVKGATLGAGFGALEPLRTGESNLKDVPKSALENALMFGTGDAALPFLGAGARTLLGKAKPKPPLPNYDGMSLTRPSGSSAGGKIEGFNNAAPITAQSKLNAKNMTPKERSAQERIDQFSRVDETPVVPDTSNHIQTKTKKNKTTLSQKTNEAYIKTVDNLHRINQFDQMVKDVTGKDLKPSDSGHTLGLNSRGSDMISRQIMEKNLVDSKGNIIGESLKDVTKAIPKGQEAAFEDYVVAKHAITRMGRGEKVYPDNMDMTIQKAELKVAEYESNPEFIKAAQKYYDYNKGLGQAWLVDTGILSQKQWDNYLEQNPHYVPNNRIFNDLEKSQQFGSKKGFANQTNPVKRAEGSQRPIVSPIESTIENTARYVKIAKQNEVAQTVYRNISKNPEDLAAWGRIVEDQPHKDYSKILETEGIEGILDDIARGYEKRTDLTKGNVISALVDGKRVHMEINDPQLLEAMTNLTPLAQHFIMDKVGKVTKTMKVLTTGLNPIFGLTRNIFRDIPMSFIASKTSNNPFVIGKDLLGSIISIVGDGKLYNAYKNSGGGHSSSVAADRNLLAQTKEKLLPSRSLGQKLKRNLITKPFHALENLNNAVETAPRLGEFKRITKKGNNSVDSKIKGLYEANDITVNFSRYGNYTKQADALYPYINAAVQGLDKFARIYKDNPKAAIAKSIGALTMPTIALFIMNHNNPDYQKVSKYTKDNFLMIPKGDGTFYKVAKPRETGIVFSSAVERALQSFVENDPEAFKEFGETFMTNFLPPGVSGIAKNGLGGILGDTVGGPLQSIVSNKDFLGRPIVSGDLERLSPKLQYDAKTSEPAKKLGSLINFSPKRIDYLVKSYGGIIGQLGIPATTKGSSIKDTLIKQITTDPNYSNDISQDYYDAKERADVKKADSKVTGEPLTNDLTPLFNKITDVLSALRKQSNTIRNDDTLSKEEKKTKQAEIQSKINEIQSSVLEMTK